MGNRRDVGVGDATASVPVGEFGEFDGFDALEVPERRYSGRYRATSAMPTQTNSKRAPPASLSPTATSQSCASAM